MTEPVGEVSNLDAPRIWTKALDPLRADVRLALPQLEAGDELRARLIGPRCPFSSTVEVSYPFRPLGPEQMQVLIPEPSLWEPECPFVYEGPVEIWSQGSLRRRSWVTHGLRTLALGPRGLAINGKAVTLRGIEVDRGTEADLLQLRQKGYNALLAAAQRTELWDLAARLGFLMLGRWDGEAARSRHAFATLGWVVPEEFAPGGDAMRRDCFGLLLRDLPSRRLPGQLSFLVVAEALVAELQPLGLPMIALKDAEQTAPAGVVGWIDRSR